jgi:hypothetical protein
MYSENSTNHETYQEEARSKPNHEDQQVEISNTKDSNMPQPNQLLQQNKEPAFTVFPMFPKEIRDLICGFAVADLAPRVVEIDVKYVRKKPRRKVSAEMDGVLVPTLTSVSKEAREWTWKENDILFQDRFTWSILIQFRSIKITSCFEVSRFRGFEALYIFFAVHEGYRDEVNMAKLNKSELVQRLQVKLRRVGIRDSLYYDSRVLSLAPLLSRLCNLESVNFLRERGRDEIFQKKKKKNQLGTNSS